MVLQTLQLFGANMIPIVYKDICEAEERMILQGCNAQGVMGSGVAKAIRAKWPGVFDIYRFEFDRGLLVPGHVVFARVDHFKFVANIITQNTYGYDGVKYATYSSLVKGLEIVRNRCKDLMITEVATPPIGCGLGGLVTEFVFELLDECLTDYGISVTVYDNVLKS